MNVKQAAWLRKPEEAAQDYRLATVTGSRKTVSHVKTSRAGKIGLAVIVLAVLALLWF